MLSNRLSDKSFTGKMSAKKQFLIINILMVVFGVTIASLTTLVLSRISSGHEELKSVNRILLQATQLKSLVAERGDAIKSLLIDAQNKPELDRKNLLDEKVAVAFKEATEVVKGTELEEPLKKVSEFANGGFKSNENDIMKDVMEGKKDDANFKFVIQYFPLRRTFEKNIDAFTESARKLTEERSSFVNESMSRIAKLVLILQIAGSALLSAALIFISRSLVRRLQGVAHELVEASVAIRERSDGQVQTAHELSDEMTLTASSLRETASAAEEINQTVARNASLAEDSKSLSEQGRRTVESGHAAVEKMLQSIAQIDQSSQSMNSEMESSFKELEKIVELFETIHEKTSSINEIVLQTRLLSFNASVEASRAGEHGKGFAIVAEEVGKLAHMSGAAAREIEDLLQGSTKQVTAAIQGVRQRLDETTRSSSMKVGEGTQSAEKCREVFRSISKDVEQINLKIGDIFQSSREQAVGVSEIAKSVQYIDQTIQKNTERAKFGATQTHEIQAQAEVLDTAVERMEHMLFGQKEGSRLAS